MKITCLDLEGVLVPEIWIGVAERSGIDALRLTTRDIADYDELMQHRLKILAEHGLGLNDIQAVIAELKPLAGAAAFLDALRARSQVIILSDTFYEFAQPLMRQLGWPTLFCHRLEVDDAGRITGYRLRQSDPKRQAVKALQALNFHVVAAGDSFNDLTMLAQADAGILFNPPSSLSQAYPQFPVTEDYAELADAIVAAQRDVDTAPA